ncbi:LINE-1 type transposase domain-containing 1 [Labeo rohita]|uniref:LINE-1 type transposase domain-containing 1 n=1 Tax=Labeo rohita TaxID=84645 RepID=A0A498MGT7_LABRO|nr:LINE-1 type transposase domain-containing 1 [Labeo rohita]
MPKPKRVSPALDEADEADDAGNMAAVAPELTPALLKEMLTTTIREEIASLRSEFLAEIRASTAALQATISSQGSKIKHIETSLNSVDERLGTLERKCQSLERDNEELKSKADDLENRSRQNNLRILGIPENVEASRPSHFMVSFFMELFGDELSQTPEIERAHRSLAPKPRSGVPPRPMIVRFLRFQMREEILRLSREHGELHYKESKILIFPDFSAELKKRRDQFKSVKADLHGADVKFRMLYPCRPLISFNGESRSFATPNAASKFLTTVIKPKQSSEMPAVDTDS